MDSFLPNESIYEKLYWDLRIKEQKVVNVLSPCCKCNVKTRSESCTKVSWCQSFNLISYFLCFSGVVAQWRHYCSDEAILPADGRD